MAALRGGAAVERAANPLYRTRTDAKLLGNDPHTGPALGPEGFLDSFFQLWGYAGPSKLLALRLSPRKPGADSFLNDRPLEFGKHAHELVHRLAGRGRGVDALLVQEKVNAKGVKLREERHEILQAAAQPIDRP